MQRPWASTFNGSIRICLLLLSLTAWNTPHPAKAATIQTLDEKSLRGLAEAFFNTWAAKDLDGYLRLWNATTPELATRQKMTAELFASGAHLTLKNFAVRQLKVEGAKAKVRVTVELQVFEAQTGREKPGYGQLARTLECVKEAGAWQVWRELSTFDELAETLAALQNESERTALLTKVQAEESELATPALARALVEQGNRFFEQGNYPQALALHDLARKLAQQLGDQAGIARALNSLGNAYWAQGDYEPAQAHFQQSLALSESLGDKAAVAGTLRNLGNLQFVQGNWEQAAELFRRGLQLSETLGDRLGVARGLGSLGVVTDAQGDFAQALEYYQQGLQQFEALQDQGGIARTLGNLAIVYFEQGNYAQALNYHQRSLTLFETLGNQAGSARTLHNIAIVYTAQGNYAQALEYGRKSLALRETLGDKPGVAKTLAGIGNIYYEQGDYAQALAYYQRSLALREALGDKEGIADTLHNLGGIYYHQGNFTQAREYLQRSLEKSEAMNHNIGIITALGFLGSVYEKQGQYDRALEYVERATTLARQRGEAETLRQLHYTAGTIQRARHQPALARQNFEEAINIIEAQRQQVAGGEDEQQRFFESKVAPYHALVHLLSTQGQPAEALGFAERAKSRALLDVLHGGRLAIQKAMTVTEREQERRLKAQLTELNAQLQTNTPGSPPRNELKPRQEKARLAYEAFQTTLYAAHPELKTQRGEAPVIQAAELAALLPTSTSALLEYVVTEQATYLFAVTRNNAQQADVRVFTLPVTRAVLAGQVERFRQQLASRELGFRTAAAQLYELLLRPAQTQLKGKTNLIIVPDDKLWELPFQALLTDRQRFLLEDAAIAYAPSLTVLREMSKRRPPTRRTAGPTTLLAFGNPLLNQMTVERATLALRGEQFKPLPEAEAEVKALGQLYGTTHSKVYVGAAAREDKLKAEASGARVLHFATHGILDNAAPLYSHLVLSPAAKEAGQNKQAKEDGLLEAWELMQLDLHADLAVLSACETARGRIGAGEGMIGLTWALFVAGVPTTVVSQWKVESAGTRELMLNFHRALNLPTEAKQPAPKSEALRQAALKLLRQRETSHPFYWAGFVLVGDSN